MFDHWWDLRVPRPLGYKTAKQLINIWQWATRCDVEVACDICGLPVEVRLGNAITNGDHWPLWVDVLCNKCWDNYSGKDGD